MQMPTMESVKDKAEQSYVVPGAVVGTLGAYYYDSKQKGSKSKSMQNKAIMASLGGLVGAAVGMAVKTQYGKDVATVAEGKSLQALPNESAEAFQARVAKAKAPAEPAGAGMSGMVPYVPAGALIGNLYQG